MKTAKILSAAFLVMAVTAASALYAADTAPINDPLAPTVAPRTAAAPGMTATTTPLGATNTTYRTGERTFQTVAIIIGLVVAVLLIAWAVRARRRTGPHVTTDAGIR